MKAGWTKVFFAQSTETFWKRTKNGLLRGLWVFDFLILAEKCQPCSLIPRTAGQLDKDIRDEMQVPAIGQSTTKVTTNPCEIDWETPSQHSPKILCILKGSRFVLPKESTHFIVGIAQTPSCRKLLKLEG